jgi:hypothetical protein
MREQRGLLFPVERREHVPQIGFVLRQAGFPSVMAPVDSIR